MIWFWRPIDSVQKTLGGDLIEKVVKTPFTLMTSLRDGVEKILQVIAQMEVVDVTPLRERISKYMDDAKLRELQGLLETSKEEFKHLAWIG